MKRHTRDVISSLVRLVDRDVTELRDAVVEVDERCSQLVARIATLEGRVDAHREYLGAFDRDHDDHSRKV